MGEYGRYIHFLHVVTGNEIKNVKMVDVIQPVLEYEHAGKKYDSSIIPKDKTMILFYLYFKRSRSTR